MTSDWTRRDVLKLLALLPALGLDLPSDRRWDRVERAGRSTDPATAPSATADRPNVLILVFDALSATNMSIYGYQRETTPNIARIAERATVYHRHYAGGSFTTPGTASLLTGTYPWTHRAMHLSGTVVDAFADNNLFAAFSSAGYYTMAYSHNLLVKTLLEQFQDYLDLAPAARELALFDDQLSDRLFAGDASTAFWAEWMYLQGTWQGPLSLFLSLADHIRLSSHRNRVDAEFSQLFPRGIPFHHELSFILEDAIDWIAKQTRLAPRPFLGYFHLYPPHDPYCTRREFVDIFKDGWEPAPKPRLRFSDGRSEVYLNRKRREYDEYLAYVDAEFGRLYNSLRHTGVLENSYLILTSDHGELFERGIHEHVTPVLYEPVMHVPLLVSAPGQRQRHDVHVPTSCVDVVPTLLHATRQAIPDWCEGQLLPGPGGAGDGSDRRVFVMDAKSNPKTGPLRKATVALVRDDYKLVSYFGYGGHDDGYELYDVANDPEERTDLYASGKPLARQLRDELDNQVRDVNEVYA